jgi:hypothetical protein
MINSAILNAILRLSCRVTRYSLTVIVRKIGFALSLAFVAVLSACNAKISEPLAPADALSDGIPITGLQPNYFRDVRFLGEPSGQIQYAMTSVHECFQLTNSETLRGRMVAISTAPEDNSLGNQFYLWFYDGVQFQNSQGLFGRSQNGLEFSHFDFSSKSIEVEQSGSMMQSFAVVPSDGKSVHMDAVQRWTANGFELEMAQINTIRIWHPEALQYLGQNQEVQIPLQCDTGIR